jgi:hypothetical protein
LADAADAHVWMLLARTMQNKNGEIGRHGLVKKPNVSQR